MSRPSVAVIGGGGAAEQLARSTEGSVDLTIFESSLVGGECPFVACMPSKSMLHDARKGVDWAAAVERRQEIVHHLDDTEHADGLHELGVQLVRARATLIDGNTIEAGGERRRFDHVVIATGAEPIVPELEGVDNCGDAIWTSDDVYRATARPERVAIVGGGVIGSEVADLFAHFGSSVTMIDAGERLFESMPPAVADIVHNALTERGVDIRVGVEAASVARTDAGVELTLDDGATITADRIVIAIGRRPSTTGLGLEALGLDPTEPLPVEQNGRVRCDGSVWAMGDVAGQGQYTHLANHHARVIADHLVGTGAQSFDEVVVGSCMFTAPPLIQVGPQWSDLVDDPDVVHASADVGSFPRAATDQLAAGHLWVAARRSTGAPIAAAGAGPKFDELIHALVIAIDGEVPIERLRHTMQPFPTVGEILGPIWRELHAALDGSD